MTAEQALRFAVYEAAECRNRDACEALCLLLPPLMSALSLEPMNGYEADSFRIEVRRALERREVQTVAQLILNVPP